MPSACERMSSFWAIIIARLPTSLLDVANQSWKISVMRSTSGWLERTIRSSHQRWSWPQASSGANGVPLGSVTGAPTSVAAPVGRVRLRTAACRPIAASASASPGFGPNPARHSRRCAWAHAERAAVDERVGGAAAGRAAEAAAGWRVGGVVTGGAAGEGVGTGAPETGAVTGGVTGFVDAAS